MDKPLDTPEIKVLHIIREEFYFMGIEYVIDKDPDFAAIWDSFFRAGGTGKIEPFQKESFLMNVWHYKNPDQLVYFIGKIVHDKSEAPDGYSTVKFSAGEYLVVTHDWLDDHERIVGEDGNGRCNRYADTVKIPEGYERNDSPASGITLIEKENSDQLLGHRYEVWVPIKKTQKA